MPPARRRRPLRRHAVVSPVVFRRPHAGPHTVVRVAGSLVRARAVALADSHIGRAFAGLVAVRRTHPHVGRADHRLVAVGRPDSGGRPAVAGFAAVHRSNARRRHVDAVHLPHSRRRSGFAAVGRSDSGHRCFVAVRRAGARRRWGIAGVVAVRRADPSE